MIFRSIKIKSTAKKGIQPSGNDPTGSTVKLDVSEENITMLFSVFLQ